MGPAVLWPPLLLSPCSLLPWVLPPSPVTAQMSPFRGRLPQAHCPFLPCFVFLPSTFCPPTPDVSFPKARPVFRSRSHSGAHINARPEHWLSRYWSKDRNEPLVGNRALRQSRFLTRRGNLCKSNYFKAYASAATTHPVLFRRPPF